VFAFQGLERARLHSLRLHDGLVGIGAKQQT
jgi:hypothetical protein